MGFDFFSGKWKGEFVYGPEYGDLEGEKASFILFVDKSEDWGFEGRIFDIDGVGVNPNVATVKGFVENGEISFVKQYPVAQTFLEDGTTQFESDKASPEIHYSGKYSGAEKLFRGVWEIEWREINQDGYPYDQYCSGTWEMRQVID